MVETVKYWFHLLDRKKCKLTTDQRTVTYMLNNFRRSQIQKFKIPNWRLELFSNRFGVKYKPGLLNSGADDLTRNFNIMVKLNRKPVS